MNLEEKSSENEPPTSKKPTRIRRKNIDYHASATQKQTFSSKSDIETLSDESDHEYVSILSKQLLRTKRGFRGAKAHQAAVRLKNAWIVQSQNSAPMHSEISARGRGGKRKRISRQELLSEHNTIVERLIAEEIERDENSNDTCRLEIETQNLPPLSEGKCRHLSLSLKV